MVGAWLRVIVCTDEHPPLGTVRVPPATVTVCAVATKLTGELTVYFELSAPLKLTANWYVAGTVVFLEQTSTVLVRAPAANSTEPVLAAPPIVNWSELTAEIATFRPDVVAVGRLIVTLLQAAIYIEGVLMVIACERETCTKSQPITSFVRDILILCSYSWENL